MKPPYKKGLLAEQKALSYLEAHHYIIIKQRYLSPYGEIDILAVNPLKKILVAVEVKFRQSLEDARICITLRQKKRIENTLLHFVSRNEQYKHFNLRLDAILFADNQQVHIENAWI